ncbi:hypothetical protein D9M68_936310 [compost metagenome]
MCGDLEVALDLLELRAGGDRTGRGVELRADAQRSDLGNQLLHEALMDVFLHQQPAAGGAPLAAVPGESGGRAPRGGVQVGVIEDDVGGLAA